MKPDLCCRNTIELEQERNELHYRHTLTQEEEERYAEIEEELLYRDRQEKYEEEMEEYRQYKLEEEEMERRNYEAAMDEHYSQCCGLDVDDGFNN